MLYDWIWRLNLNLKDDNLYLHLRILFCVHECPRPSNVRCLTVTNNGGSVVTGAASTTSQRGGVAPAVSVSPASAVSPEYRASEYRFSPELSCSRRSYVLVLPSPHFLQLLLDRGGVAVLGCSCGVRSCCAIPMWVGYWWIMNYETLNLEFQQLELLLSSMIVEKFNLILIIFLKCCYFHIATIQFDVDCLL